MATNSGTGTAVGLGLRVYSLLSASALASFECCCGTLGSESPSFSKELAKAGIGKEVGEALDTAEDDRGERHVPQEG